MKILRVIFALLALCIVACEEPQQPVAAETTIASLGTPGDNEIWFTTIDGRHLMALNDEAFNANITDIEYIEYGINVIRFDAPLTTIGAGAFDNCRNINNVSLPESVTSIGEKAFFECIQLECLTLGTKVRECGEKAFDNCLSLYSLHISSIGDWCQIEFANSTANPLCYGAILIVNGHKIKKLEIPSWISHIGDYAFCNYSVMSSVKIPAKIKSIGKDAFKGCEGLSSVDIEDLAAWCRMEFATVESNPLIAAGTLLLNGKSISKLSIDGIDKIVPQAFMGCENITSITTDDSLNTIGDEAFRGCPNLSSVTLGKGVTAINGRAFMGCMELKSVICHATTPPTLADKYVFDYNADSRKIYVPSESLNAYKSHEQWSRYADSIEAIN